MAAYHDKRRSIDDILGGFGSDFNSAWDATPAAGDDFDPIPQGVYRCLFSDGGVQESSTGKPSYRAEFSVLDGPHANRRVWHHCWLTKAALALAKRDLAKLGIHRPEQMRQPAPSGWIYEVKVALRTQDDGRTRNEVVGFKRVADASLGNLDADDPDPSRPIKDASFDPNNL